VAINASLLNLNSNISYRIFQFKSLWIHRPEAGLQLAVAEADDLDPAGPTHRVKPRDDR